MRTLALATLGLASALALGACASTGPERATSSNGYSSELSKLQSQCDARNGTLIPTGQLSGARPQLDYACDIRSGPARAGRQD